ncbi:hypothetical protein ALQ26_00737 [Pseudomonas amygdali pv. lachrymans]|nr:hypothetical protein ALQ26_00737 [Pseudomonas amygdali pv. lachrymans]
MLADQLLVAIRHRLGRLQGRLGAVGIGLIDSRVDLIELLTGFDVATFGKQTFENDAVDLRAYLGDAECGGPAWQLGGQGIGLCFEGNDADLRGLRGRGRLFLLATATEQGCQGDGSDQNGNSWLELHEDPRGRSLLSQQYVEVLKNISAR